MEKSLFNSRAVIGGFLIEAVMSNNCCDESNNELSVNGLCPPPRSRTGSSKKPWKDGYTVGSHAKIANTKETCAFFNGIPQNGHSYYNHMSWFPQPEKLSGGTRRLHQSAWVFEVFLCCWECVGARKAFFNRGSGRKPREIIIVNRAQRISCWSVAAIRPSAFLLYEWIRLGETRSWAIFWILARLVWLQL